MRLGHALYLWPREVNVQVALGLEGLLELVGLDVLEGRRRAVSDVLHTGIAALLCLFNELVV